MERAPPLSTFSSGSFPDGYVKLSIFHFQKQLFPQQSVSRVILLLLRSLKLPLHQRQWGRKMMGWCILLLNEDKHIYFSCSSSVCTVKGGVQVRRPEETGKQYVALRKWIYGINIEFAELLATQINSFANSNSKYTDLQQRLPLWCPASSSKVNFSWCFCILFLVCVLNKN